MCVYAVDFPYLPYVVNLLKGISFWNFDIYILYYIYTYIYISKALNPLPYIIIYPTSCCVQDVGIMSGPYCVSTQAQTRQEGTQNPGNLWHFGVLSGSFWRTDHLPDEYGVSGCFWQRFTYYNNCSCRSSEKRVVSGRLKPLKTLV